MNWRWPRRRSRVAVLGDIGEFAPPAPLQMQLWLADVRIAAGVLTAIADAAIAKPSCARDYQPDMREYARRILEIIEHERRAEVPIDAKVLRLKQ
jgi:hypothetical protein